MLRISATRIISVPTLKLLPATRSPFFTFIKLIIPSIGEVMTVLDKSLSAFDNCACALWIEASPLFNPSLAPL